MVEIALCLAIIGIALVSIIGVLPIGMNTQRDNREETLVNQDATVLLEAIRGGARGLDDLTNYVYAITNIWALYDANTNIISIGTNGYSYLGSGLNGTPMVPPLPLTNGQIIVGLLSTPKYLNPSGGPIPNLILGGYSNHVVAYVHSISGPAIESRRRPMTLCAAIPSAIRSCVSMLRWWWMCRRSGSRYLIPMVPWSIRTGWFGRRPFP